jgi:hypothetical protein
MLQRAVKSAAYAWNSRLTGCGAPRLRVISASPQRRPVKRDGISSITMRSRRWCPDAFRDAGECYAAERAAFTEPYAEDPPGSWFAAVREADVQINAVDFSWSLDGSLPGTRSLEAIVAHELGHVLGLDHPCEFGRLARQGPKPLCAEAGHRAALMYPLPIERGRVPVIAPLPGEAATVCDFYSKPVDTVVHE